MLDGTHYFECDCGHDEHTLRFTLDMDFWGGEEAEPVMHASMYLSPNYTGWHRLVNGIKYIFGHRSRYGDFGGWILPPNDAKRLRSMCDEFITKIEEHDSSSDERACDAAIAPRDYIGMPKVPTDA